MRRDCCLVLKIETGLLLSSDIDAVELTASYFTVGVLKAMT